MLHNGDPRIRDYQSNFYFVLANMYVAKGSLYLTLRNNAPNPNTYTVFKVLDFKKLYKTSILLTMPSKSQIEAQNGKLPAFSALKKDLDDMMGVEGNCGTSGALRRAAYNMRAALDTVLFRPWACAFPIDHSKPKRELVDESLDIWGHSGIWNYRKYQSYLSHMAAAEPEIQKFYATNFSLDNEAAARLAGSSLAYALLSGFDDGRIEDKDHLLHKKLLQGMSADALRQVAIDGKTEEADSESLLTFAIEHPELLKILLDKGVDPNRQNAFGKTPLMYAAQFNALESARVLLEHGASTEATTLKSIDTCSYVIKSSYLTALHYAVRYGSADLIRALVEYGAPTYMKDSEGFTPYDYLVLKKTSFGEANQNLTARDRRELAKALIPPDDDRKLRLSKKENQKAEKLYREGKLEAAYRSLRRSIALNPESERPLSNLSLVTLKLGRTGESAKISTTIIGKAKSDAEKANAYFNLGLACRKAELSGAGFSDYDYDGQTYCQLSYDGKVDQSIISSFLMAYKLKPTQERFHTILSLVQDVDVGQGRARTAWKFPDEGTGLKSLYSTRGSLNFLVDSSKDVPFSQVFSRYGQEDRPLTVKRKEVIPLTDTLKLERWFLEDILWPIRLDHKICCPAFPMAFDDRVKLIEIFSSNQDDAPSRSKVATLRQGISGEVILIFYGDDMDWRLEGDLSRTEGVYVHGRSVVQLPVGKSVPVFLDKASAYPDPKGSSFNPNSRSYIGLAIDAIIDVGRNEILTLTDEVVAQNKHSPPLQKAAPIATPPEK